MDSYAKSGAVVGIFILLVGGLFSLYNTGFTDNRVTGLAVGNQITGRSLWNPFSWFAAATTGTTPPDTEDPLVVSY
ncbi:hypothetical protein HZB01_01360 [Candidatus Woesearchaeota archaeon]|nr:hypothetical protein [Candidatus Woesearchaeota archaeon]